jgi:hypothetical protein
MPTLIARTALKRAISRYLIGQGYGQGHERRCWVRAPTDPSRAGEPMALPEATAAVTAPSDGRRRPQPQTRDFDYIIHIAVIPTGRAGAGVAQRFEVWVEPKRAFAAEAPIDRYDCGPNTRILKGASGGHPTSDGR